MTYAKQLLTAIQQHDFSQDHILLRKALDHDQPEVLASLAESLTDYGFTDLAKEVYRALIARFPHEDLFKVYLAEILLNDGRDNDGLTLLYGVKPSSSAYLDSLLVQADYYQTNGLLETAKDKLLEAQKIAPEEDAVKFGLAELDYLKGDYKQALSLYQDLLQRQKNFGGVNLRQRLFQTQAKLGDYEAASQIINDQGDDLLLDIDSKYQAGLIELAVGNNKKAIKYLDEVIAQSPDYVNAYPLLAQAYVHEHNDEQVLRAAQTGLTYNELDETLYALGARAAINLKRLSVAEDLLKKGIKEVPDNLDLRLQLSDLYLQEKKEQENLALFKDLPVDSLTPEVHWHLAQSYQALDKRQQAKSEFLLAYPDFKEKADFLRQMIFFFNNESRNQEIMQQLLSQYLRLNPEDADMQDLYQQYLAKKH